MPTAAERASPGMWPAQGWLRWPKLHHWGTLSTELPASPSTTETASENGTASNNKSHCDHGQAAAQNVSDNFSGSQLCQGDTTADEHGFSLGSTLNLADSSLNTYADRATAAATTGCTAPHTSRKPFQLSSMISGCARESRQFLHTPVTSQDPACLKPQIIAQHTATSHTPLPLSALTWS